MSKLRHIKPGNRLLLGLMLLALALSTYGCASYPDDPEQRYSPNPWDHTEGWESGGPAGGMFRQ
jgi:hypothetical protein